MEQLIANQETYLAGIGLVVGVIAVIGMRSVMLRASKLLSGWLLIIVASPLFAFGCASFACNQPPNVSHYTSGNESLSPADVKLRYEAYQYSTKSAERSREQFATPWAVMIAGFGASLLAAGVYVVVMEHQKR